MNGDDEYRYGPDTVERRKPGPLDKLATSMERIEKKLDAHIALTAPVIEAYGKVQVGYKVLSWGQRTFNWVLDKWKPILIMFGGYQIVSHGGTWAEVWEKIMRIFK